MSGMSLLSPLPPHNYQNAVWVSLQQRSYVATVTFIKLTVLNTLLAVMNLVLEGCSVLSLGKKESALQGGTAGPPSQLLTMCHSSLTQHFTNQPWTVDQNDSTLYIGSKTYSVPSEKPCTSISKDKGMVKKIPKKSPLKAQHPV